MVRCETQENIDYYWNRLSAVLEAEQCGWLKDRYGVNWQVVPEDMDRMMREEGIEMDTGYTIPKDARIGHVHLKVSDIQRSLDFYCGLLGFELTTTYGSDAAFISAGRYHHHIGLNVWFSKNAPPAPRNTAGLFHIAICYPTRKDLAIIFRRLQDAGYPLSGSSDHGVSEALYLEDPDQNGLELYWDKPRDQWPHKEDGSLDMYTRRLDIGDLLRELQ